MTGARHPSDAESPPTAAATSSIIATRALSPAYWFTMFAASALGTNFGDFWIDDVGLGRVTSFAALTSVCLAAITIDRRWGARIEVGFWVAIVVLRAAATTCADYLTHDLGLSYPLVATILGLASIGLGALSIPDATRPGAPATDLRFWAAMLVAGLSGTAGGDFTSHAMGLGAAALGLCLVLVASIILRRICIPSVLVGYWIVILAERTAATPVGDWLAAKVGLPVAMLCTGGLLAAALTMRKVGGGTVAARWKHAR